MEIFAVRSAIGVLPVDAKAVRRTFEWHTLQGTTELPIPKVLFESMSFPFSQGGDMLVP